MKEHRRKKKMFREKLIIFLGGITCLCVLLLIVVSLSGEGSSLLEGNILSLGNHSVEITKLPTTTANETRPTPLSSDKADTIQNTPHPSEEPTDLTDTIYSYLQGPKSWTKGLDWSGEWGNAFYDGGSFGGFGCGLCCLANVYSTISQYQCSPVDMYRYVKKHTGYTGGLAVEWGYMRRSLTYLGFDCHVEQKPQKYRDFQHNVASSLSCIVLVSSNDSKIYWKDTPGHYVTVFAYDKSTDKIFLADSGDPNHNRRWVKLKTIYRSLKTASAWQYLMVEDYHPSKDNWKHKTTSGTWNRPTYLKKN